MSAVAESTIAPELDVGAHPMGLAARLLLVHDVRELPEMIRRLEIPALVAFFEKKAQELIRKKWRGAHGARSRGTRSRQRSL